MLSLIFPCVFVSKPYMCMKRKYNRKETIIENINNNHLRTNSYENQNSNYYCESNVQGSFSHRCTCRNLRLLSRYVSQAYLEASKGDRFLIINRRTVSFNRRDSSHECRKRMMKMTYWSLSHRFVRALCSSLSLTKK